MNIKILTLLGFLFALISSYEMDGEVLVLTDADDFPAVIKDNPYILVEIYAPWCGHCKKLTPVYLEAAAALKQAGSQIKLAKVDATKETGLAKLHGVRSYPTLIYYINGTRVPYKGQRTKEGIIEWCTKKLLPTVTVLDTDSYNKLKEENKGVQVILFSSDEGKKQEFNNIALGDEHNQYFYAPAELLTSDGEILLIRDFDKEIKYSGEISQLTAWLENEGRPKLLPLDSRTIESIWTKNTKALAFIPAGSQYDVKTHDIIQELANEKVGGLLFTEVKIEDDIYLKLESWIKVKFDRPRIIIFDNTKKVKYVMEGEINKERIVEFIESFNSGNAKEFETGMQDQYTDKVEEKDPTVDIAGEEL